MGYLDQIARPADLKALTPAQLAVLAKEIREELIGTISDLGGHLASSLGAVELCLALHYAYDAPVDQLVWDMGYQAFAHKLITGRRAQFKTLKQFKGLTGFNNKDESPEYDLFTTGHGGTVLSTALGLAMARDQEKAKRHVVAIIGDASLGEGMALEALNHIGHLKQTNVVVVLNDNRMSISKPVGGLSRYLTRIITNPTYNRIRDTVEERAKRLPHGKALVRLGKKIDESVKGMFLPGLVFEELGFRYVGPVDGHNLPELVGILKNIKQISGPILLHVSTTKGKGYKLAERDPEKFHKVDYPFEIESGQPKEGRPKANGRAKKPAETFTGAFGEEMMKIAEDDRRLMAIIAAMPEGTGLAEFARRFPSQFIDVGMAEQHAVGLAAGLAKGGARPVVAIYSTFLQRAYDQIMHEMCLQELPVILAIDRASLVGEDGPTHHGVFDVGYLRVLPSIHIVSPKDPAELRLMLQWALQQDKPVALRYARGGIVCGEALGRPAKVVTGKAELLRNGKDIALVALGSMVYPALVAAEQLAREGIDATVYNARFVKPLDEAMVKHAAQHGAIVTLEEGALAGGFGSAVSESLDALHLSATPHLRIGLPDQFIEHGRRQQLLELCELDWQSVARRISQWYPSAKPAVSDMPLLSEPA